ncbi:MAG: hypothetical protein A2027_03610 [Thermodesulfovibrio sp. RBG_19FT_COMBO_41_18]|nr:MAG: hypothetical protein A2027_03610 [Thermodesulfovibrio sp. RBG_19FT_COMBO_41_18]
MLKKNKSDTSLIEKIYKNAEKAIEFGAGMPALTFVFDDDSCFIFYVEKAGDFLVLRSYDTEHKIYKPLLIIGEFERSRSDRGH